MRGKEEKYIELLDKFFARVDSLYRAGRNFDDLTRMTEAEQETWLKWGHDFFSFFTDYPNNAQLEFIEWVKFGGEVAIAKAQHSSSRQPYAVRIARTMFNEPDLVRKEYIKEGLFKTREQEIVEKNTFRERFIKGLETQHDLYVKLERTPSPFMIARIQPVFYFSKECPVYAVLRWINGCQLDKFCIIHKRNSKKRLLAFWKICKLIEKIHILGAIHRDISPANILIEDQTETPFLIDFSNTKDLLQNRNLTVPGTVLGNLRFSAPEQIQEKSAHLASYASDVYALGWLLYFILCLKFPPDHIWSRQLRKRERTELPRIFQNLFVGATSQEMTDRPDISSFVNELEEIFRREGINFEETQHKKTKPRGFYQISQSDKTIIETVKLKDFEDFKLEVNNLKSKIDDIEKKFDEFKSLLLKALSHLNI